MFLLKVYVPSLNYKDCEILVLNECGDGDSLAPDPDPINPNPSPRIPDPIIMPLLIQLAR
jgi:hypothetical protein